jgi:TATA-binding protein-associated factor
MRKLCNSPALVMKEGHKQYEDTQRLLAKQGTSLRDPVHAPKLTALRDLLVDCGIGTEPSSENDLTTETSYVSPHRALIFCQMKEMLDMVQNDVLNTFGWTGRLNQASDKKSSTNSTLILHMTAFS